MTAKPIDFLSFDEVVTAAKNEIGAEFIGLSYAPPFTRVDVYMIDVDPDEPGDVRVEYEGGDLFDLGGEEEFYNLDDVPTEAKSLFYARKSDLGNGDAHIRGMVSEHVLQELLPGLSAADTYRSEADFIKSASARFLSFWRQS